MTSLPRKYINQCLGLVAAGISSVAARIPKHIQYSGEREHHELSPLTKHSPFRSLQHSMRSTDSIDARSIYDIAIRRIPRRALPALRNLPHTVPSLHPASHSLSALRNPPHAVSAVPGYEVKDPADTASLSLTVRTLTTPTPTPTQCPKRVWPPTVAQKEEGAECLHHKHCPGRDSDRPGPLARGLSTKTNTLCSRPPVPPRTVPRVWPRSAPRVLSRRRTAALTFSSEEQTDGQRPRRLLCGLRALHRPHVAHCVRPLNDSLAECTDSKLR